MRERGSERERGTKKKRGQRHTQRVTERDTGGGGGGRRQERERERVRDGKRGGLREREQLLSTWTVTSR